ncbi:hypothetical protein [Siminovitchia terrae]|uniref:hypothetical protein n=1 Tax=Siminovitchia terrae TaxID=1914933 RepID=UPI0028AE8446|nr:hypothetical protein [Siminovitchia terrae]
MAVTINQDQLGLKDQSINGLADRLSKVNWYENAGKEGAEAEQTFRSFMQKLNVDNYEVKWVSKEEAADTICKLNFEGSELWETLSVLPDMLKKKVDKLDQSQLLEKAVDTLPEYVFHLAFEKAVQIFPEEKVVSFLVGHAMYVAVLAATSEMAGETELFSPLLELLESGHVPLGPEKNTIYLL